MLTGGLVFLLSLASAVAQPLAEDSRDYVEPWQYRWGDSPRSVASGLSFAEAPIQEVVAPGQESADGWRALPKTATPQPPGRQGHRFLWLRTRLVGKEMHDPTLQIELLNQLIEAYLDGQLVYRFGTLDGEGPEARRFLGYPEHFIPLGEGYAGRTLTLRIYSAHINIGIASHLRIGTKARLIRDTMRRDVGKAVVGSVLCALGLLVLGLYLALRSERSYLYYGGFALSIGIWLFCQMKNRTLLVEWPFMWTHVEVFSLYTAAACLGLFIAQVLGRGLFGLMPILAWILVAYDVGSGLLVVLHVVNVMQTLWPFELLLLAIIVYSLASLVPLLRQRNTEAWLFAAGFVTAVTLAIYDLLAGLSLVPRIDPPLSHPGQGVFVLTLGFILVRRFSRVHSDLIDMRKTLSQQVRALEAHNTEIENLNVELRHQIEARSKQLITSLIGGDSSSLEEATRTFMPGDLIGERYRVIRTIGQGAMGVVYEVERVHDNRRFAAKVLSGRPHRRELARFAREAQLLARLKHENLVSIADVELSDSHLAYIIMELVEGSTLEDESAHFGDLKFVLPILRQLAEALAKVHTAGIVHRDLKPANILVAQAAAGAAPVIKVVDFGVSALLLGDTDHGSASTTEAVRASESASSEKVAAVIEQMASTDPATHAETHKSSSGISRPDRGDNLTQTGVIMGTPLYMAPELLRGARLAQPASDMFSFGIIAYELTTGSTPVDMPPLLMGLKPQQRWYAPLSVRCPELPEHIGELFERCLDVLPENRPTAAQIAEALRNA